MQVCSRNHRVLQSAKLNILVAIAYHLRKQPYIFPMVGGNKVEHLEANIEALRLELTDEHVEGIESVVPFDIGYPLKYIVSIFVLRSCCSDLSLMLYFRSRVMDLLTTLTSVRC